MKKMILIFTLSLTLIFTACTQIPFLGRSPSEVEETTPAVTETPVAPEETATLQPSSSEKTVFTVWVPPQFDPQNGTPSGELFKSRLEEYSSQNPSLTIDVRVKDLSGPGSILNTLRTAQEAAPGALPDVIAIPRALMEKTAEEELIIPFGEYAAFFEEKSWYSFADQLAVYNEKTYGIPFAADILVYAYQSGSFENPPGTWEELLSTSQVMIFPASDSDALVTLAFYESLGGEFAQLNDAYLVDRTPILEVLTFYQQAHQEEVMPFWLTQFETDQQAWNAYTERRSTQVITWSSSFLQANAPNTTLAALPTSNGKAFSYTTGWVWSIVDRGSEQVDVGVQFIDFFTEERYLAEWTTEAGFVPPLSSSMNFWGKAEVETNFFERVLPAANLIPSQKFLDHAGLVFQEAVISVLEDQMDPEEAVSQIQDQLQDQ